MDAYFINTSVEQCGVHQFGRFLYDVIEPSQKFKFQYCNFPDTRLFLDAMLEYKPPVIIYNRHPLIQGCTMDAPYHFDWNPTEIMLYHDGVVDESQWDGIIFSDPTQCDHGKWHYIGRPIPNWNPASGLAMNKKFTVGLHGFNGAWSMEMINAVRSELGCAHIRLHLPPSPFIDPRGAAAQHVANEIQKLVSGSDISVEINHNFMNDVSQLLLWLSRNNINVYVRPLSPWSGVSSALDLAMACGQPIAINKCQAFRHMINLKPSICIEDNSLHQIWAEGLISLLPLREKWSHTNVRKEFEDAVTKSMG